MPVTLGPTPKYQFTDNNGKYAAFGLLYTYNWNTRQPEPTYSDPAELKPRTNPIQLDSIGRPQGDGGLIYWDDATSYYLELRSNTGALIWSTVEPYAPGGSGGGNVTTNIEYENLFINGQFRFFPRASYTPIPDSIDVLADGGWGFRRNGTNTEASLTFRRFSLDNTAAPTSPTFYLNYVADSPGVNETKLDIYYRVKDVRTLANTTITIGLWARSAIAGTYNIEVKALQHFGTGGGASANVITDLGTITPTTTADTYTITETLPDLSGKTLGTNLDDYFEIIFRMPLNSVANLELTNAYWKVGNAVNGYPYETYEEVDAEVKALEIPDYTRTTDFATDDTAYPMEMAYNALALLPNQGTLQPRWLPTFPVGFSMYCWRATAPDGWIFMEGQSLLKQGQYNRLFEALGGAIFGQQEDNAVSLIDGDDVFIQVTQKGAASPVSAGTSGFTIARISQGFNNSGISLFKENGPTLEFQNDAFGEFTPPATAGNSGMTVTTLSTGSPSVASVWEIEALPASSLTAGTYITFDTTTGSYYLYFQINGVGADPAIPGRTGRPLNLFDTDSDVNVAQKLALAVPGFEYSRVTATAASTLTPGAYISFGLLIGEYALWFSIDGVGSVPVLPGTTVIEIKLAGSDGPEAVAQKIHYALTPLLWTLADTRGLFVRVWDNGAGVDPDAASRTNRGDGTTGDVIGTRQEDENKSHTHGYDKSSVSGTVQDGTEDNIRNGFTLTQSASSGGSESRPKNIYAAIAIKY